MGSAPPSKPGRVLACVLCRQRKLKCNRQFPCSNCILSHAQCTPWTPTSRRPRRTVPQRILIERLHRYEALLRQHRIDFDPFDSDATTPKDSTHGDHSDENLAGTPSQQSSPAATAANATGGPKDTSVLYCRDNDASHKRRWKGQCLLLQLRF